MKRKIAISRTSGTLLVLLMLLAGLLAVKTVSSQTPEDDRSKDKGEVYRQMQNLPDVISQEEAEKINESYQASAELARKNYRSWLNEFNQKDIQKDIDLRSLDRVELLASASSPPASLEEAVDKASSVVTGQAVDINFVPTDYYSKVVVTFEVQRVIKSNKDTQMGERIAVTFPGGPRPMPDNPSEAVLAYATWAPFVLPGDNALLMLTENPQNLDEAVPLASYGVSTIENSIVIPEHESPLESEFAGKSEDEVLNMLDQIVDSGR